MNDTNKTERPKLFPPKALLSRKPKLSLAFAGHNVREDEPKRLSPTLAPHEVRRIVAGILG
jgi:hypothetical protein